MTASRIEHGPNPPETSDQVAVKGRLSLRVREGSRNVESRCLEWNRRGLTTHISLCSCSCLQRDTSVLTCTYLSSRSLNDTIESPHHHVHSSAFASLNRRGDDVDIIF